MDGINLKSSVSSNPQHTMQVLVVPPVMALLSSVEDVEETISHHKNLSSSVLERRFPQQSSLSQ